MNLKIIKKKLSQSNIGSKIIFLEEIDSTNTYAKSISNEVLHGTVVIAEKQNLGKGRNGKTWKSPSGVGIWMSVILKSMIDVENIAKVPSMISLAVREGIEKSIGLQTQIKWPNDIIVNKKKVCGILSESLLKSGTVDYIIIGIGVNVNQDESFFCDIPWSSSLSIEKGRKFEREEIIGNILVCIEKYYNKFVKTKSLDIDELSKNSVFMNKMVRVSLENEEVIGEVTGFKEDGSILIKSSGEIINTNSLKVSVRGMNGYID